MPRRIVILAAAILLIFAVLPAGAASKTPPIRHPSYLSVREPDFPSPRPTRPTWPQHRSTGLPAPSRAIPASVPYTGNHLALWLCIHSYEGSWTDPNAPYWGGLQMGWGFMSAYAPGLLATLGTADHWSSTQQIAVAENAWKINGYSVAWLTSQWPISGRDCA